jgi:hypothetical protein
MCFYHIVQHESWKGSCAAVHSPLSTEVGYSRQTRFVLCRKPTTNQNRVDVATILCVCISSIRRARLRFIEERTNRQHTVRNFFDRSVPPPGLIDPRIRAS